MFSVKTQHSNPHTATGLFGALYNFILVVLDIGLLWSIFWFANEARLSAAIPSFISSSVRLSLVTVVPRYLCRIVLTALAKLRLSTCLMCPGVTALGMRSPLHQSPIPRLITCKSNDLVNPHTCVTNTWQALLLPWRHEQSQSLVTSSEKGKGKGHPITSHEGPELE